MRVTFGELTELATDHLLAAQDVDLAGATPAQHRAVTAALGDCVGAVERLLATPAHRPRAADRDLPWRHAADSGARGLAQARRLLRAAQPPPGPDPAGAAHPTAAHLQLARSAIGAGRDLLATHVLPTAAGPVDRSDLAALLDTPDARRQLTATAAAHAARLAAIAEAAALARHTTERGPAAWLVLDAAAQLAAAGAATRIAAARSPRPDRFLPAVPALAPPRRAPVRAGETPRTLLAEAVAGAERLHLLAFRERVAGRPDHHGAAALGTVAVGMASSHLAAARILAALHQPPAEDAPDLSPAATAAQAAFGTWAAIRQAWGGVRDTTPARAADVLRAEAADLAVRTGRLAYADPAWTPRPGASHIPRPVHQLAPDPQTLAELLDGLRRLATASALLATEHARIVDLLAAGRRLAVPTRTLPDHRDVPRPWTDAPRAVTAALPPLYQQAGTAAAASAHLLTQAARAPRAPDPARTARARLDQRRLASYGHQPPGASDGTHPPLGRSIVHNGPTIEL